MIHEAQQCGVPVITANHGGMGEYVVDGENGYTFVHRDVMSLADAMNRAVENPDELVRLGQRGYLYSKDGQIPSKEDHAVAVMNHYQRLITPASEVMR